MPVLCDVATVDKLKSLPVNKNNAACLSQVKLIFSLSAHPTPFSWNDAASQCD